jgi:hypothetical protein
MSETKISKQIADYLDAARIYNLRLNSGRVQKGGKWIQLCPLGTPDRFALVKVSGSAYGFGVFIEVKKEGEKASIEQAECHKKIRRAGGIVIVADSFDSFLKQFKEIR